MLTVIILKLDHINDNLIIKKREGHGMVQRSGSLNDDGKLNFSASSLSLLTLELFSSSSLSLFLCFIFWPY